MKKTLLHMVVLILVLAGCGDRVGVAPLGDLPALTRPLSYENDEATKFSKAISEATGLTELSAMPNEVKDRRDGWWIVGHWYIPSQPTAEDWGIVGDNSYRVVNWLDKTEGIMGKLVINVWTNDKPPHYLTQIVFDKGATPGGFALKHQALAGAIVKTPPDLADNRAFCEYMNKLYVAAPSDRKIAAECRR